MICNDCQNHFIPRCGYLGDICDECCDMMNEDARRQEEADEIERQRFEDELDDAALEQQELEDYDETDEAYGRYDSGDEYDDYTYDNDSDLWNES